MNWNIEIIGVLAAILTTSGFIPQLVKTIRTKNISGVSLTMYLVLFFGIIGWLIYGFLINSFAIKLANSVSGLLVFTQILLIILYKKENEVL